MGSHFSTSYSAHRERLLRWLMLAALVCLFPLFFIGGPGWSSGPLIKSTWDLGHPIFFGLLTFYSRPWRFLSGWRLWVWFSLAVVILGLGIEFTQSFSGGDVSARDLLRNLTGLWMVLAARHWASFRGPLRARDWLIRVVVLGLVSIDLIPVGRIAVQQVHVSLLLPELYDFEQDEPERFWRGNVSKSKGEACGSIADNPLSIRMTTRRYSGATLDNLPSDWRGYERLTLVLWNPQDYEISVTLRINDLAHEKGQNVYRDRFNRSFQIKPGVNRIQQDLKAVATAPQDREMDMDDIRRLMLFTSNLNQPARLCLGELRLADTEPSA